MIIKKRWPFVGLLTALLLVGVFALVGPHKAANAEDDLLLDLRHDACTVIMVAKGASVDGSTMTTHTCDCGTCDWTWGHIPAADHKPGSTRKIYHINQYKTWPPKEGLKWELYKKDFTGLEIPEIPHTFAYHRGMFGYMNENQVAISESTIGAVRKLNNNTPSAKFDITMLTLIAMERSKTAREAIKVMGDAAENFGYGFNDGGEMLAVSDPNEVWIFEIMPAGPLWTPETGKPGAVWCAQRIPDDNVSVCPNESRIGEIDLNNKDFFVASPNVISFAVEQKLYDPAAGKPFSFKRAYSPHEGSAMSSQGRASRLWRFFDIVAPSLKISPQTQNMDLPFSVKPDKKISVQDVMNMTRDKSYGTIFDPVMGIRGGPYLNPNYWRNTRLIGVSNVEYTSLVQCRSWLPDPIGGIEWLAFGPQDTSCYVPLYAGINDLPKSFGIGDHFEFNRGSARWAFDYVDFHTQVIYSEAIEDVKKSQLEYETAAVQKTAEIDKQAQDLYAKSPAKAREFLTKYCLDNANKVVNAWWELGDRLLVKYNHFGFYDSTRRSRGRGKPYSQTWQKAVRMIDVLSEPEPQRQR